MYSPQPFHRLGVGDTFRYRNIAWRKFALHDRNGIFCNAENLKDPTHDALFAEDVIVDPISIHPITTRVTDIIHRLRQQFYRDQNARRLLANKSHAPPPPTPPRTKDEPDHE